KSMQETVRNEANILFGAVIHDTLGDEFRITVFAAGFDPDTVEPDKSACLRRSNFVTNPTEEAPSIHTTGEQERFTGEGFDQELPEPVSISQTANVHPEYNDDVIEDLDIPDFLK